MGLLDDVVNRIKGGKVRSFAYLPSSRRDRLLFLRSLKEAVARRRSFSASSTFSSQVRRFVALFWIALLRHWDHHRRYSRRLQRRRYHYRDFATIAGLDYYRMGMEYYLGRSYDSR